ncbi:MAG: hypothetical protein IJ234_00250 [Clostridia bacterium]|nr:hypothetical protein [Clostridia bacterium]
MQKGYKREGRGMAVLRCFIGIFIVIILILLAYFLLRMDYSDKLTEESLNAMRDYVVTTPTPEPTQGVVLALADATDAPTDAEGGFAADAPTYFDPTTPQATPIMTPTPTPTATPVATPIPSDMIAKTTKDKPKLGEESTYDVRVGITRFERAAANENKVIVLEGYAYINNEQYDGSTGAVYMILRQDGSSHYFVAEANCIDGISGIAHTDAICANPSMSDWRAIVDVSDFPDDVYTVGAVVGCKVKGKMQYAYTRMGSDTTFTVLNGQVLGSVSVGSEASVEAAFANAGSEVTEETPAAELPFEEVIEMPTEESELPIETQAPSITVG